MSTPLEIAEREAAEAEAENPDEEEPKPIEPEEPEADAPPEAEPSSQAAVEESFKALAASEKSHRTRVANIMGSDFGDVELCPLCATFTAGFVLPYAALTADEGLKTAVRRLNGDAPQAELQQAKDAQQCPDCDGWGDVLTGAKVERGKQIPCIRCNGKGHISKLYVPDQQSGQAAAAPFVPGAVVSPGTTGYGAGGNDPWPDYTTAFIPMPSGVPDQYSRPAGHPRWGAPETADGVKL